MGDPGERALERGLVDLLVVGPALDVDRRHRDEAVIDRQVHQLLLGQHAAERVVLVAVGAADHDQLQRVWREPRDLLDHRREVRHDRQVADLGEERKHAERGGRVVERDAGARLDPLGRRRGDLALGVRHLGEPEAERALVERGRLGGGAAPHLAQDADRLERVEVPVDRHRAHVEALGEIAHGDAVLLQQQLLDRVPALAARDALVLGRHDPAQVAAASGSGRAPVRPDSTRPSTNAMTSSQRSSIVSMSASLVTAGGLNLSTLPAPPKYVSSPRSSAWSSASRHASVAGSRVSRSTTRSTPMNRPGPRTSPITGWCSAISSKRSVARRPIAAHRSTSPSSSTMSITASAAAAWRGWFWNVRMCQGVASISGVIRSADAITAPNGKPPPHALPIVTMSGLTS